MLFMVKNWNKNSVLLALSAVLKRNQRAQWFCSGKLGISYYNNQRKSLLAGAVMSLFGFGKRYEKNNLSDNIGDTKSKNLLLRLQFASQLRHCTCFVLRWLKWDLAGLYWRILDLVLLCFCGCLVLWLILTELHLLLLRNINPSDSLAQTFVSLLGALLPFYLGLWRHVW